MYVVTPAPAKAVATPRMARLVHFIRSALYAIFRFRWSASLIARATMVNVGFANPKVGKTELPETYRFSIEWTRQSGSVTPEPGSVDMRVVPIWCD